MGEKKDHTYFICCAVHRAFAAKVKEFGGCGKAVATLFFDVANVVAGYGVAPGAKNAFRQIFACCAALEDCGRWIPWIG